MWLGGQGDVWFGGQGDLWLEGEGDVWLGGERDGNGVVRWGGWGSPATL